MDEIRLIIKRCKPQPHLEVHFNDHVEFWTEDGTVKTGESQVEQVEVVDDGEPKKETA